MSTNQTVQSVPLKGMRRACHECLCDNQNMKAQCSVDKKNPRCTGMHYITVSRKLATLCVAGYLMWLHSHYILLMSLNPCDVRVSECVACVMFKFVSVLQVHV